MPTSAPLPSKCHQFDGKGAEVGPPLDGAGRDIEYILVNVIDPNRVIGAPYFLPLGLLSGFSSLVPYAGPIFTGAFITLVTLATGGAVKALIALGYFLLYGQLEGNVLGPVVFRRTVHLDPLVTLLAVLFLAELLGVAGAVVAVPAVAVVQIFVRELVAARRDRLSADASVLPPLFEPEPSPTASPPVMVERLSPR